LRKYSIFNENTNFYRAMNICNTKFKNDFAPINKDSNLSELREYSRVYFHHLFKDKDFWLRVWLV